jgi:DNA-binding response OmpR family regulator
MRDVTVNDILVVDDDHAIVEFVIGALREAGYLCCAAYDGDSALLAIETVRPALVLLDLHLPDLSGLDVVAQLRRHGLAHVPVVLMTADVTAAAQLPTSTFPEYLLKPFEIDALLACVAHDVRPQRRRTRLQGAHPGKRGERVPTEARSGREWGSWTTRG